MIVLAACGRSGFDAIDAMGARDASSDGAATVPIEFDALATANAVNSATLTWTHTISGTEPILLVAISDRTNQSAGTPASVASVTYGSTSLQKLTGVQPTGTLDNFELWGLSAPPIGSATVTVTLASPTSGESALSVSYLGVAQSGPIDRVGTAVATNATAVELAWTTNASHAWAFAAAMDQGGFVMAFAPAPSQTSRQLNLVDSQSLEIQSAADEADIATPSTVDFQWTSASASAEWIAVGASFIPAGS